MCSATCHDSGFLSVEPEMFPGNPSAPEETSKLKKTISHCCTIQQATFVLLLYKLKCQESKYAWSTPIQSIITRFQYTLLTLWYHLICLSSNYKDMIERCIFSCTKLSIMLSYILFCNLAYKTFLTNGSTF